MAKNYRWRDRYYNASNAITSGYFISPFGLKNGIGTKENPYSKNIGFADNKTYIFAPGVYEKTFSASYYGSHFIGGTGNPKDIEAYLKGTVAGSCHNLTIKHWDSFSGKLNNCIIDGIITGNLTIVTAKQCLIKKYSDTLNSQFMPNANFMSFLDTEVYMANAGINSLNLSLFSNTKISIPSASTLSTLRNNYYAFDNCQFKIGTMPEYKELQGSTEHELRQRFVSLCAEGGVNENDIPSGLIDGNSMKMHRWIFTKDCTTGGCVIKDSEIDYFMKNNLLTQLGWKRPVTRVILDPNSAKQNNIAITENLEITNGNLSIDSDIDISKLPSQKMSAKSNIIWLGEGKQTLKSINIMHNLATQYGVMIDSDPSISPIGKGQVEEGEFYLIRTKSSGVEYLTYNGVEYSTALNERNNVFVGAKDVKTWEGSDNIVVYKVNDLAVSNTIRARIVDTIPSQKYTTGAALPNNYWCIVEPDDFSDRSGSVTLSDGVEYPCMGSFLSKGETIKATNKCHVRRCWIDEFDITNQSDKEFWAKIQKPYWFHLVPDDPRCLLDRNNPLSVEMQKDDKGGYIASGHPDFYSSLTAENGIPKPGYDITGKYLQIELVITTLNPM